MAPLRSNSLKAQFEDLTDPTPRDFDPEDEPTGNGQSDDQESGSEDDSNHDDGAAARDHYQAVGKSRLREPKQPLLGPRYSGAKVARQDLNFDDDDEHDPFAGKSDDEDISEDLESNVEEMDHDSAIRADSEDGEEQDDDSESEAEDDPDLVKAQRDEERAKVRKLMAEERKKVASTLSAVARDDIEKGRAVKTQRATFDALLNTRVKLQKALVGVNTLSGVMQHDKNNLSHQPAEDVFASAETAAFRLWLILTDLRDSLAAARTGKKRTHAEFSTDTPTTNLLAYTSTQEAESRPHRDAILNKWSAKTRGAAALTPRNRLNQSSDPTLSDVLSEQLSRTDGRLASRTKIPRSCAPDQLAKQQSRHKTGDYEPTTNNEEEDIYDDTDFYGVLLQRLLEQRGDAADTSALTLPTGADAGAAGYKMRRDARTKRPTDNKSSKGRRMKYTVHEKLQNFMAAEDRGSWGPRRVDELFGSLFGRRMGLGEDEDGVESADEEEEEAVVDAKFKMF